MCGIIGMTGRNEEKVLDAARTFTYRGPDAIGIFSDARITLGHNRLCIIDLEARSNQPMWDASGRIGIVFNGEIYNFRELRTILIEQFNCFFSTESDTEVLIEGYKIWGDSLTDYLRGMYAFAIYDKRHGTVTLFSDHLAIKPLYYAHTKDDFIFASELKGVLKLLKEKGQMPLVDSNAVDLYFALGYVPAPMTLYQGVRRLTPRTIAKFDLSSSQLKVVQTDQEVAKCLTNKELQDLVERKVRTHLVADVPVGVFFSGGSDSSLIVSILKKYDINLETFSVALDGRDDDVHYFTQIAENLGIKPNVFKFGHREFDNLYSEVMDKIDDPISDNSLFPTFFIAREAARKVKVVLSGEGGDEFFFGYPRSLALNSIRNGTVDRHVGISEYLYIHLPNFTGKNALFERLFLFLHRPIAYYLLVHTPGKDQLTLRQWKAAKNVLARDQNTRFLDADFYLVNGLLRKLDMATMYTSIEGRVPLLDRDIIEAARALPAPAKTTRETKPVLKTILSQYLPAHLVYRKKSGFGLASQLFRTSSQIRGDIIPAISYLEKRNLLPLASAPTFDYLANKNPNLGFAILFLYHALCNGERI